MPVSLLLEGVVDFIWGPPLVAFIFLANFYLLTKSRLRPLLLARHGLSLILKREVDVADGLSHYKTFCNAIAATVGLGNISGVAIAVKQGGPGVVVWMWVAALLGMNMKFFECSAALVLREKDRRGMWRGGAMIGARRLFPKHGNKLALLFSVCGLVGTLSMFQVNQISSLASENYAIDPRLTAGVLLVLTSWVIWGGLRRLSNVCATIVPAMSVLYVGACLLILGANAEHLPGVFMSIVRGAFDPGAAVGGVASYGVIHVMLTGIKRATFSNEAGLGTAPLAHANSASQEPIAEGLVAMLGPIFDTMLVCSLTALVVLVSFPGGVLPAATGILITMRAFSMNLGVAGEVFLAASVALFGFSTILGMANYNQKCWDDLFEDRWFGGPLGYRAWYLGTIAMGAVVTSANVINLIDIAYGLMTIPNIIVTLGAAPMVVDELRKYVDGHLWKTKERQRA